MLSDAAAVDARTGSALSAAQVFADGDSGVPVERPAYAGTDFAIVRDRRIAELYVFFDTIVV